MSFINDRRALRVADTGVHDNCCGPNRWTAIAARRPCSSTTAPPTARVTPASTAVAKGELIEGSDDVFIGEAVEVEGGGDQAAGR